MKNIYDLNLHQSTTIVREENEAQPSPLPQVYGILRVPGGWIYQSEASSTFVPFSDDREVLTKDTPKSQILFNRISFRDIAKAVSLGEGGEVNLSIAQINECIFVLRAVLRSYTDLEILEFIRRP